MGRSVASVSFGKDSLAMVLYILENGLPLDEVIFYDTGMEFDAIYRNRDKLAAILEQRAIKYTELHPKNPFLYDMIERPVVSEKKGSHSGYGWCGGVCRWGTAYKIRAIDLHAAGATTHYVGIALDEPRRLERLSPPKVALLSEIGMKEADALLYCRERGWNWNETSPTAPNGCVDLYEILDRVSCWCCANKNRRELRNIHKFLPEYWNRLETLQSQIDRPMKKYSSKEYGDYGNVHRMALIFEKEEDE